MRNKKMLTGMLATMLSVSMVLSSGNIVKAQEVEQTTEILETIMESQTEETGTEVETDVTEEVSTEEISTENEADESIVEEISTEVGEKELIADETGQYQAIFTEAGQAIYVQEQAPGEVKKFLIICDKSGDYALRYTDKDGDMGRVLFMVSKESGGFEGINLQPFTGFTGTMNEYYESNVALHLESGKTYVVTLESATEKEMSYELLFTEEPTITKIRVDHEAYIVEAGGTNWWGLSGYPFIVTYSDGSEQHLHGPRYHRIEDASGIDDPYLPYDDYGNYFVFELKDKTQQFAFEHMRAGVYPVTITVSGKQVFEDVVKIQDLDELAGKVIVRLEQSFINEKTAEIKNAKDNETVIIDMKKADGQIATVIPAEFLDALYGRDVNIILNMGTYTWTINGKDIWADEIIDINLEVKLDGNAISSDKVKELVGNKVARQMSLTSNGWFGFDTTLTINVGNEYKGQNASLYYYNDEGKFELQEQSIIAENGYVNFNFSHASDYVIAMEETQKNEENKNESTEDNNNTSTDNDENKPIEDNKESIKDESNKEQTDKNESPKTGYENNGYVWAVLFAGVGLVFTKTFIKRKIK